jgi:hypothetical protein
MKRMWFLHGLKFIAFVAVAVAALGGVVMLLWNWLAPELFGWHEIGFIQAVGLFALCKILLGGFRGHAGRHLHWRARMMDRWEQMSEEERARFRAGMRHGRCGHREAPAEAPQSPAS